MDKAGTLFVGCASHRFNLAMKDKLSEYQDLIERVHELMKKIKIPSLARNCENIRTWVQRATTQRDGLLHTKCFIGIRRFIPCLLTSILRISKTFLLSPREDKTVHDLCKQLGDLNSVTKYLQGESLTLSEVRMLFDEVIHDHRDLTDRLSSTANIVKKPSP